MKIGTGDESQMIFTRRRILRLTLAASVLGLPRIGLAAQPHDIAGLFADPRSASAVGRAYLQGHAAPRPTLAALQATVLDELRAGAPMRFGLEARLRDCIRRDFELGRVVMVNGWMLSRIEAQACAIACLSEGRNS